MDSPIAIADRQELIYLLVEAAELEHSVCCTYLFAAFSLKNGSEEGLTPVQAQAVASWRKAIIEVAVQEMVHLALVNNLLTAIGAAPHLGKPNLPVRSRYAPEIELSLTPFDEVTLERFLYIERPEGMDIAGMARDFAISLVPPPVETIATILPAPRAFSSVGALYRGIEAGFRALAARRGEERLFNGPPRAQITQRYFRFPELIPVTGLASAVRAIETIVEEGEGARGHWQDSHFGRFVTIRDQYRALRAQDQGFAPARPVLDNPYARPPLEAAGDGLPPINPIDDPLAIRVGDLFDACYEAMLYMLARFFGHSGESEEELQTLATTAINAMFMLVEPLGSLLTTLPAGSRFPGRTAGPDFALGRPVLVLPHKRAAWSNIQERLLELASYCGDLTSQAGAPAALDEIRRNLETLAAALAPHVERQYAASTVVS